MELIGHQQLQALRPVVVEQDGIHVHVVTDSSAPEGLAGWLTWKPAGATIASLSMTSAGRVAASVVLWILMAPFAVMALANLQAGAAEQSAPTAIEQALMEHACSTTLPLGALASDVHEACLRGQLVMLRADFGRDLGRLSASDRRTLDSVCGGIREDRGRDAYLDCLGTQLASLRSRRSRGRAAPSDAAAPPPAPVSAPSTTPAAPAPQASLAVGRSSGLWIGAALLALGVAAGGVFLAMRARRAPRKCRVCGKDVPVAGELCQECRHEAAEALRRAAAERADEQRAQEEERRRKSELEEEQRRQRARQEEEERLRQQQQEEVRQRENEARRRREEEADRRSQAAASQEEFDPYAVLEVSRDASKDAIRAAYEEARLKCDPAQVSHLGMEIQEHFKAKLQAVERAYQMLAE